MINSAAGGSTAGSGWSLHTQLQSTENNTWLLWYFLPLDRPRRQIGKSVWFMIVWNTTLIDKGYSVATSHLSCLVLTTQKWSQTHRGPSLMQYLTWKINKNEATKFRPNINKRFVWTLFFYIHCTCWLKWLKMYFLIRVSHFNCWLLHIPPLNCVLFYNLP